MKKIFLSDGDVNKEYIVGKIIGGDELIKHIIELGFTNGTPLTILSKTKQGIIVKIRDSRLALGYDIASKICVCELCATREM